MNDHLCLVNFFFVIQDPPPSSGNSDNGKEETFLTAVLVFELAFIHLHCRNSIVMENNRKQIDLTF